MTEHTPIIALQNATKRYAPEGRAALDGVSLDVSRGEFLAIIGPSGCGKTTLLSLINRLTEPTEGEVRFDGDAVRGLDPVGLRRRIGYVFQDVGLFPHMTVAENVAITPRLLGWDRERMARRVDELLELVRLSPAQHRARRPAELSGGQRQRVGIARALAAEPRVMLMDEPFGALDPLTREGLAGDYRSLHDNLGLTTILITHDMIEAVLLADRIAVLHEGRLIETGTPHELLTAPQSDEVRALMATPVRQAERLNALIARGGRPAA